MPGEPKINSLSSITIYLSICVREERRGGPRNREFLRQRSVSIAHTHTTLLCVRPKVVLIVGTTLLSQ